MANEQRTVRPQCTGVAATAGGGKGGGRAGRGLGLGPGRWGGGAGTRAGGGGGGGEGPRGGGGGGRGAGDGPGSREGRARAAGAWLRGDRQLASVRGWPPPRRPHAPTRARDAHFPSLAARVPGTLEMTVGAVGAALRPCHLPGAGGGARGSELILFCSSTKAGPGVAFRAGRLQPRTPPAATPRVCQAAPRPQATIVSLETHRPECLIAVMKWKFK